MHVAIICIATLDGRIAPPGFGSEADRCFLEEQRHQSDGSLLGAASLRKGNPLMRGPAGQPLPGRVRAFVSASGNIPGDRDIFTEKPVPLIFTSREQRAALRQRLGQRAEIHTIGTQPEAGGLDLQAIIPILEKRGVQRLLIEGGGRLNYAALQSGIVDEVLLTLAPRISGLAASPSLADGPLLLGEPFIKLTLTSCRQADTGELFLRYRLKNQKEIFR